MLRLILILLGFQWLWAEVPLKTLPQEQGWELFHKLLSEDISLGENPKSLDTALDLFRTALKTTPLDTSAAVGFVRAALLKGNHTSMEKNSKKELYLEAKNTIEKVLDKYPSSGEVIYWYCAALGSWAQIYGVLAAAKAGVADKLKSLCEKLITMPSSKMKARGHRVLGRVHFEAPYIPFILSWPSNKEAIKHLQNSIALDKENPLSYSYLAEALYEEGDKKNAAKLLRECQQLQPRKPFQLNDKEDIEKCEKLAVELKLN